MITESLITIGGKEKRIIWNGIADALVASESKPGSWHQLVFVDRRWVCDCDGYRWHKICSHSRAVAVDLNVHWASRKVAS